MEDKLKLLSENAVKHFEIHSSQRVQVLNFFIVLESLFVTGVLAILSSDINRLIGAFVCFAISFFAVCFFFMDNRMKWMIKASERVMHEIEAKLAVSNKLCVFSYTEFHINDHLKGKRIYMPSWSKILRLIYGFFFFIGVLGVALFLVLFFIGK